MAKTAHAPSVEQTEKLTKVLIYDFDRGLKSLADDDRIEKVFGYKPRRFIRTTLSGHSLTKSISLV